MGDRATLPPPPGMSGSALGVILDKSDSWIVAETFLWLSFLLETDHELYYTNTCNLRHFFC